MSTTVLVTCRRLFAVTLLTAGLALHADDKAAKPTEPVVPEGYKLVKLPSGAAVMVQEEANPYGQVSQGNVTTSSSSTDTYHPERIDYTKISSFSSKQFDTGASVSKESSMGSGQNAFVMKQYGDQTWSKSVAPSMDDKYAASAPGAYTHNATGWDKSFTTSTANLGTKNESELASIASPDQNKTATLSPSKVSSFDYAMGTKKYEGPEMRVIHQDLSKMNDGLMQMKDLPNRPLTVDEVRDLINHGVKPNTDSGPPPESKALNDPGYQPQPMRDMPTSDDSKGDAIPGPGMMSSPSASIPVPPENSEPLPQGPIIVQPPSGTMSAPIALPVSSGGTTP